MLGKVVFLFLCIVSFSHAQEFDDEFDEGFDNIDESIMVEEAVKQSYYLTGKLSQKANYATHNQSPHNNLNSLQTSLYLEYEKSFTDNHKLRVSAKTFYDFIYNVKNDRNYAQEEKNSLQKETEIFDLYLQGKISSNMDYKIGRQVVVWGRSDTIRVTDILNPLDNRSPGITDIEDLRLPVGMAKIDYYFGNYNVNFIFIGETRYSKLPAYKSDFYILNTRLPDEKIDKKPTIALSFNANFSSWDMSLYAAKVKSDETRAHDDIYMLGYAFDYIYDSWLFKAEGVYFDKYRLNNTQDKTFSNILVGLEYNGIEETVISFDIANKYLPNTKDVTQSALRINSDFMNARLKANYLISLYGRRFNEGGFQRVWLEYELNDALKSTLGYVDYMSGSSLFDVIEDNDMFFTSLEYSF